MNPHGILGLSNIRDLLTTFSPSMDFFAITTGDGRIKIWDTLKGQLQTEFADIMPTDEASLYQKSERGHLSVDYTCMKWMALDKKRKRKSMSAVLLLGTGSGDVLALDVSVGQLKWRFNDCHPGGVGAISFATHGSYIYSTGSDGMVCKMDPISGNYLGKFKASTKGIFSIAVSLDGKLLATAAGRLKIFSCLDEKKIQMFSGHPGTVRCIIFTGDGKYILSSSLGERYVAVWRIDSSKKQSAICVLAMEHPAVILDSWCKNDDGIHTEIYVLAVSETGVCYIWHGKDADGLRNVKPTKISISYQDDISRNQQSTKPKIYAAKLLSGTMDGSFHVFLVSGLLVKPTFQKLVMQSGIDVELNSFQNGVLLPSQSRISKQTQDLQPGVIALDRSNAEDAVLPIPKSFEIHDTKNRLQNLIIDSDKVASDRLYKSSRSARSKKSSDAISKEQVDTTRFCMEDKLISLGIISNKSECMSESTLSSTLLKGIDLKDNIPPRKIKKEILSMLSSNALELLNVLMSTWVSRPCSGKYILPWIYGILVNHYNNVIFQESASEVLDNLYKITESRKLALPSLFQLSGRLRIVTAQIDKVSHNKTLTMVGLNKDETKNEDEDGDEEDVDEILYGSGSEDDQSQNSSDENEEKI